MLAAWLSSVARALIPLRLRLQMLGIARRASAWPPVGAVSFGSLRRTSPISRKFGFDRGPCIDRYYIEAFLAQNASDIRGDVLEVADATYTRRFGGARVRRSDVLSVDVNVDATVVADLAHADHLEPERFDCVILTQTLQFVYDVPSALATVHRILKPGGVLLLTVPGITQISRYDMDRWGEFWRFTSLAIRRMLDQSFVNGDVEVRAFGNVLASIALLHGLAVGDVHAHELEPFDADYEVIIAARAVRSTPSS